MTISIIYFYPENKIGEYVGDNKIGGLLLVLDFGSGDEPAKKSSTTQEAKLVLPKPENLVFIIFHFHLKNPKVIGFTQVPYNLRLGENTKNLGEIFLEDPKNAIRELNRVIPLYIVFYNYLNQGNITALINSFGGLYLFHKNGLGINPGINYFSGDHLVKYWHLAVTDQKFISNTKRYLLNKDLVTNIVVSLFQKIKGSEVSLKAEGFSGFEKNLLSSSKKNISSSELLSLIDFYSDSWEKFVYMQLPLSRNLSTNYRDFSISTGSILKQILSGYWQKLSGKKIQGRMENFLSKIKKRDNKSLIKEAKIEILNASGIYRQAKHLRDKLTQKGLNVIQFMNFPHSHLDRTVVLFRNFNVGRNEKILSLVQDAIGFSPMALYQIDLSVMPDISIIIGKDLTSY